MNNFLKHHFPQGRGKNFFSRFELKKINRHKLSLAIIITLMIAVVTLFIFKWQKKEIAEVVEEAHKAQQSLIYAQVALANQDFNRGLKDLKEAQSHLALTKQKFTPYLFIKKIPYLRRQIIALENVLNGGQNLTAGLSSLTELAAEIFNQLDISDKNEKLGDISAEAKKLALQKLAQSPTQLSGVQADIELAIYFIEQIPQKGLLKSVRQAVDPVKEKLPLLRSLTEKILPFAETLPLLAGYPEEKTYLFLLQNNRELRPTGGFIGTYGIVKLLNGEITNFSTDNTYNLDVQAEGIITEEAPAAIKKHTTSQKWYLRDINWSPDFPTTAQKAIDKYLEEGGEERKIDGVIAVTPTFIESLLDLTGPLQVDGYTFDSNNLFLTLQKQVEFGFKDDGIAFEDRKDIIGSLGTKLLDQLFALPKEKIKDFWKIFQDDVEEKQIILFSADPMAEELIRRQGWAGEMKKTAGDFIMVVDANLAALKTDAVMERRVEYKVNLTDDKLIGAVEIYYKNNGNFSDLYTRYRSYTRVYVPQGSELIEDGGFVTNDRYRGGEASKAEIYEESFKNRSGEEITYTVIAGFISIEPEEEGVVRLKYELPEEIRKELFEGYYQLYAQKQAGVINNNLNFSFDVGKNVVDYSPLDILQKNGNNQVLYSGDFKEDKQFEITLK